MAVAGPTPVSVVRWWSVSVGNGMSVGGKVVRSLAVEKPADVADFTVTGSFLRIWAGRNGRFVPCVLGEVSVCDFGEMGIEHGRRRTEGTDLGYGEAGEV